MQTHFARTALSRALGIALLGMASSSALAQAQEQAQTQQATTQQATTQQAPTQVAQADTAATAAQAPAGSQDAVNLDRVVATGFRKSLEYSTQAKRDAVNVTDTVFAEDMGKFPDLNIAESLNRIPGVQLARDVNGEGLNVAIRGLGSSFTKTTLNGSSIATASIGLNNQNQNREVDLNLFPTEFFTQLSVSKTPLASQLEGGVSGVVDMRSARPFDNPGTHLTYSLQGDYNETSEKYSPRGSLIGSWTNDDNTFGALVGLSSVKGKIGVEGFESVGWTNPGLTQVQCGTGTSMTIQPANCNVGGGGNWRIPDRVPTTAGAGLVPGTLIDSNFLLANNPGLSIQQISEALIPRLGRPVHMSGDRDRDAFVSSLEWRPNESAQFYLDTMYTQAHRTNDRIDINLIGRNGNMIPLNMQVDANNVVTSATFTNAQFFLEARPYIEDVKFWNVNPGGTFWFSDDLKLDFQANMSRSWLFRESPTVLVNTPFTTVQYNNNGGDTPTWTTGVDLNDPNAGWTWAGGRVNINNEKRVVETKGARADLQFGEDKSNIRVGIAYDEASRRIQGFDNSAAWEDAACRGLNPDGSVPNPRPACVGGPLAGVPQPSLASYLRPGPFGFVTVDFDRFKNDTNYYALRDNAPESGSSNTAATTGLIDEQNLGAYVEANGEAEVWNRPLRINAGVRYVSTDQTTSGPVQTGTTRVWRTLQSDYDKMLPSMNLAWDAAENVVLRMSGSRTLTRPNPSDMLPNTNFSDISAQQASQGNPDLQPYLSTNFDLGGEWYTGAEGYVGLTYFRKDIEGFTVLGTNTIPFNDLGIPYDSLLPSQQLALDQRGGPDNATVTVQQQVNADGTLKIQGWEATWVQPLDRLVEGLGFTANYTNVKQTSEGQGVPAVAIGVAPNLWNATAYWENDITSVRLSYTWTDEMITSGFNENGIPYARRYLDSRGQLDLSASYTLANIRSQPQITLNVINITSEPLRQTFAFDNAAYEYYEPGYTVLLGVRGTF